MLARLKKILPIIGCAVGVLIPALALGQATLLPNAVQTYTKDDGTPVSSGKVEYYIPNTFTKKNTWQDSGKTVLNPNPVPLNAGGKPDNGNYAGTYGDGTYRQILKDADDNVIWDGLTASTGGGGGGGGGGGTTTGDGAYVGTVMAWSGFVPPPNYVFAFGQELSRATYSQYFNTVTSLQNVTCVTAQPVLSGLSDTLQIKIGGAVEVSCMPPGVTVVSKTANSVTLSANATATTAVSARFFSTGNGNGSTTFNALNASGNVLVGRPNMSGTDPGTLTTAFYGTNPLGLGQIGGSQSKTFLVGNLPAHHHAVFLNDPGHLHAYTRWDGALQASIGTAVPGGAPSGASTSAEVTGIQVRSATGGGGTINQTADTGNADPFSVIQPAVTVNYVVKVLPDASVSIGNVVTSLGGMIGDIVCGSGVTCAGQTISLAVAGGTVFGPPSSIPGQPACFDNLTGDLIAVCSNSSNITLLFASYTDLRASSFGATPTTAWVQGRTGSTQLGSGMFQLDPSDVVSADNDGTILVDAAGNRWKRVGTQGEINAGWFGLASANSSAANDTALAKSVAALTVSGSPTGVLVIPKGLFDFGSLILDNSIGLRVTGVSGGRSSAVLRCTSTTCIKIRGAFDSVIEYLELRATTAATAWLIDAQHVPGFTVDTRQVVIRNVTFDGDGSASGGSYQVRGANAYQVSSLYFDNCTFLRLLTAINGQVNGAPSGTNYANNITIKDSTFTAIMGYPIVNPGENWTIIGGYTQMLAGGGFLSDGAGRVAYSDAAANVFSNLVFINHGVYDTTVGGTSFLNVGAGSGVTIEGGLWGGTNTSNLLIANGALKGLKLNVNGTNFNYIAFANVAGQQAWSFKGSVVTGSLNLVGNPNNVTGLDTDGTSPSWSRGTFANTGYRYNADGTIEQWGIATTLGTGSSSINFPLTFPSACWNVQAILVSPAAVTNILSINSQCNTASVSVNINGSGNSNVYWRAIGR